MPALVPLTVMRTSGGMAVAHGPRRTRHVCWGMQRRPKVCSCEPPGHASCAPLAWALGQKCCQCSILTAVLCYLMLDSLGQECMRSGHSTPVVKAPYVLLHQGDMCIPTRLNPGTWHMAKPWQWSVQVGSPWYYVYNPAGQSTDVTELPP